MIKKFTQLLAFSLLFILATSFNVNATELETTEQEPVFVPEELTVKFDQATVEKGYTIENSNKHFRLGFGPGVLLEPVKIVFKDYDHKLFTFPEGKEPASGVYEFDIINKDAYNNELPLMLEIINDIQDNGLKGLYFYNGVVDEWQQLPTRSITSTSVRSLIHLPYAKLVVLKDKNMEVGHASWYAYKYCNCAASPDYPKGTELKVTNLENGKSVVVVVNDYGPNRSIFPERIIDLDKVAFQQIGSLGEGVLRQVAVEPVNQVLATN